jgi:winged helix DNA-binding protein
MPEPTLTQRRLNRALLARQLLLERSHVSLTDALDAVGGLQTQYAPSGYIGSWSRLEGFRRATLTGALEGRSVIQATVMRATIHMVSAGDYWPFAIATRPAREQWYLRAAATQVRGVDMDRAVRRVRDDLADGPKRQDELVARLESEGISRGVWNGLAQLVHLVRVPPSGTWEQRRANRYALAEQWLGKPSIDEADAVVHLVRRYLAGFGPASRADVASWTGLSATTLKPALAAIELRRFRDEDGRELIDLPDAPLPDEDVAPPVRFLPVWDANLLVHARRTGILPEPYRPRIFNTKTPHSFPTFLVNGAVSGTWRYEDGRVEVDAFEGLPARQRRAVDDEAERLAAWHGEDGA